ncbi:hypothetical protein NCCP691_27940 [Noviherbaspirillum aridicola]|uniref:HTH cro/C1-type domain-containing protein n=2 Tax=Noviherbaspirillum aridicola TaxID=2849687 RepID=A0ABQ4Q7M3_9BURK|nr:hypothetical protein NCCP691_27940 [Noviherbaspirillum aridicola]
MATNQSYQSDTHTHSVYAPGRLLATLASWFNLTTDRSLSKRLQLSPQVLRGIRSGAIAITPSLLILMAEAAGKTVDELRELLGERRRKARMTCYGRQAMRPALA